MADSAEPAEPPEEALPAGDDEPPVLSAREAAARGLPGWPRPGDPFPPPPAAVPAGRGGDQVIPRPLTATVGRPAPWAHLDPGRRAVTLADVRRALVAAGAPIPSEMEYQPLTSRGSAVLAPLYEADGECYVVLTRRTWDLRSHQGEVSFPGGRKDPADPDFRTTALREAHEEVGLDPESVEIIGELDHLATVWSRSFIVPYVGVLPGRPELVANPAEVSAVIHVPLAELLDPSIYREERWTFPGGWERPIFFFELVGDTLWGATGAMVRQLLGLVTGTLERGQLDHR